MSCTFFFRLRSLTILPLCTIFLFCAAPVANAKSGEPKWIRISSSHFVILTDAGRDQGDKVALHLEQMYTLFGQLLAKNTVNLSQPLNIIVLRSEGEYENAVPRINGQPLSAPGFVIPGDDRFYVVLDAESGDSYRAISYAFARWLLKYNYPPTPAWFDEGFAEYFSSADFQEKQAFIGGEPAGEPLQMTSAGNTESLPTLLQTSPWIPFANLLATTSQPEHAAPLRRALFRGESWMLMHYLFDNDKMSELGAYFGLVESQHVPVAQAVQSAFGISSAQLEQAVKDYFDRKLRTGKTAKNAPPMDRFANSIPLPESGLGVGTSAQSVPLDEAQASVGEMEVRLPEHRMQARAQIQQLLKQSQEAQAIGYRSLAWIALQKGDFAPAKTDLDQALQADQNDAMSHYYFAQMEYRIAEKQRGQAPELANMMVGLRMVIDKFPEFAEAYNLLAVARLEGGGVNSALDAIHTAIQLAPRCESCILHLAQIYLGLKKWGQATELLESLQNNPNVQIAADAARALKDLPYLKKYGVALDEEAQNADSGAGSAASQNESGSEDDDSDENSSAQSEPQAPVKLTPDTRPVKFLSGELLSVDCSEPPHAVLKLEVHGSVHTIHVDDFHNVAVIGADKFSCDWKDQKVALNYQGEISKMNIISIELQ
jgi:thioredoxin-like negative regulator of GroEL